MQNRFIGLLAAGLLATSAVQASIVTGTWGFSIGGYTGTYSFTGLDTSVVYDNSTAAGFSVTTNFATSGTNEFSYSGGTLYLGANVSGEGVKTMLISPPVNDWALWSINNPFSGSTSGFFQYSGTSSNGAYISGTALVTEPATVPEPGTLALVSLCLAGLAPTVRRRTSAEDKKLV